MKKRYNLAAVALLVVGVGAYLIAADHIDTPAVTGTGDVSLGTDITDVYGFQSPENTNNLVLVVNTQGLMSPGTSASAKFPENNLFQINIDNTGDNVEDLVFQCLVRNGKLRVYGPTAPAQKGITSSIVTTAPITETAVTAYSGSASPSVGTNANGVKIFAGPRDDPFFFDLARFREVIAGTQTAFRKPGVDTFAGTNVMSIVVEAPKSLLGGSGTLNVWAESKVKK